MQRFALALALACPATAAAAESYECVRSRICAGEVGKAACLEFGADDAGDPIRLMVADGSAGTIRVSDETLPLTLDQRHGGGLLDLSFPNSVGGPRAVMFLDMSQGRAVAVQLTGLEVEMIDMTCKEAG